MKINIEKIAHKFKEKDSKNSPRSYKRVNIKINGGNSEAAET
jgi:hypothetical protein